MSDEWRLTAELDGDETTVGRLVADIVGRLPGAGRTTRDGRTLRVYSESEAEAARAEALVLGLLEKTTLGYELWHDRWDEDEGDWEEIAPDLPPGVEPDVVEEDEGVDDEPQAAEEEARAPAGEGESSSFPGAAASLKEAGALVLVTFTDRDAASALRAGLSEAGVQTVSRRRGVGIPAADDGAAKELAMHLRSTLPPDTRIETTRVPGRRRA